LHQVGTSSLLIYMMHGHTYIKLSNTVNLIAVLKYLNVKILKYQLIYIKLQFL